MCGPEVIVNLRYTEFIRFIRKIRIYTVYTAYIYVDGNLIYGLGQPYVYAPYIYGSGQPYSCLKLLAAGLCDGLKRCL